MNKNMMIILSK